MEHSRLSDTTLYLWLSRRQLKMARNPLDEDLQEILESAGQHWDCLQTGGTGVR